MNSGDRTWVLLFARQALCQLSSLSSPCLASLVEFSLYLFSWWQELVAPGSQGMPADPPGKQSVFNNRMRTGTVENFSLSSFQRGNSAWRGGVFSQVSMNVVVLLPACISFRGQTWLHYAYSCPQCWRMASDGVALHLRQYVKGTLTSVSSMGKMTWCFFFYHSTGYLFSF